MIYVQIVHTLSTFDVTMMFVSGTKITSQPSDAHGHNTTQHNFSRQENEINYHMRLTISIILSPRDGSDNLHQEFEINCKRKIIGNKIMQCERRENVVYSILHSPDFISIIHLNI